MVNYRVIQDGERSSLSGIFDTYAQVIEVIKNVIGKNVIGPDKWKHPTINDYEEMLYIQGVYEFPKFTVELSGKAYSVEFRTVDNLFFKPSNVAFLHSGGEKLVLREARVYPYRSREMRRLRKYVGENKFNDRSYALIVHDVVRAPEDETFAFIPEKYILAGNKMMQRVFPDMRFVPYFRPLEMDGNTFYYVKRYLEKIVSDIREKERLISKLWMMGLCIFPDSDPSAVYEEDGQPVLIDPDFLLYNRQRPCRREASTIRTENEGLDITRVGKMIEELQKRYGNIEFIDFVTDGHELESVLFDESYFTHG